MSWVAVPGFETEYAVNELGQVMNINTMRFLSIQEDEYGEPIVFLKHSGKRGKRRISVLLKLFEDQSSVARPVGVGTRMGSRHG